MAYFDDLASKSALGFYLGDTVNDIQKNILKLTGLTTGQNVRHIKVLGTELGAFCTQKVISSLDHLSRPMDV